MIDDRIKSLNISQRLQTIINMAQTGNVMADIGTDHAYVPISLIKNKAYLKAIAADVNQNALMIAQKNIDLYGLSNVIDCVLSNGLENIDISLDCIIISGMGGEVIADILSKSLEKIYCAEHLILQAQSKPELLRKTLLDLKLYPVDETILYEDNHFYNIIKTGKDDSKLNQILSKYDFDTYLLYGLLPLENSQIFQTYLLSKITQYKQILHSMESHSIKDSIRTHKIKTKLSISKILRI